MIRAATRIIVLTTGLLLAGAAFAQERGDDLPRKSPNASVSQAVGVTEVTVTYGRPSVRGRDIFGGLVPYGEVWRLGANEATTITFSDDVRVQGVPLAAGTYALFALPRPGFWRFIFNETENQWGAYEYDASNDALRVPTRPREAERHWEMMTFTFEEVTSESADLVMHWNTLNVSLSISTDTDAIVRRQARSRVPEAEDWQMPYRYAQYALEQGIYPEEAIGWAGRSVTLGENYRNLAVLARLYAQVGNHAEAVDVGERAVRAGQAMQQQPGDLSALRQDVAEWKSER